MFDAQCDLAAVVYDRDQDPDDVLLGFADDLKRQGVRPAGLVQHGHRRAGALLSATMVHNEATVPLFVDATAHSEGPRLDPLRLSSAARELIGVIDRGADLLIVNRFGRQEREGRGLSPLIQYALDADVPVVIAVPTFRFPDWIRLVEGMCVKLRRSRRTRGVVARCVGTRQRPAAI